MIDVIKIEKIEGALKALGQHPAVGQDLFRLLNGLSETQDLCYGMAKHAGWHDGIDYTDKREVTTKLCLIHSAVSEAMEGVRKGKKDDHLPHRLAVEVELADAVIRIFDLAEAMNLDIPGALIEKLAFNTTRADHTREHRAGAGGKKI